MGKSLIAFFSRAGENYFGGEFRFVDIGNTKIAAEKLRQLTGADLFEIQMETPYSDNYRECVKEAKRHFDENASPGLVSFPDGIDEYDQIFLGYPNYCGTIPMPVFTFLEHFDFTGKKIYPFCTNEGSGMARSVGDIRKLCPTADVEDGLSLKGSLVDSCDEDLKNWLSQQS